MPKEALKNVVEAVTARIGNPLVTTYLFAFIGYNWKFFGVLIWSKFPIEQRILGAEFNYITTPNTWLYPLFYAGLYLVVMPWLLVAYEKYAERPIRTRKEEKAKSETMLFLALKERSRAVRELQLIESGAADIQELSNERDELKKEIAELNIKNTTLAVQINSEKEIIAQKESETKKYSSKIQKGELAVENLQRQLNMSKEQTQRIESYSTHLETLIKNYNKYQSELSTIHNNFVSQTGALQRIFKSKSIAIPSSINEAFEQIASNLSDILKKSNQIYKPPRPVPDEDFM